MNNFEELVTDLMHRRADTIEVTADDPKMMGLAKSDTFSQARPRPQRLVTRSLYVDSGAAHVVSGRVLPSRGPR
ncbi:MAG: hypothetical protein ACI8TP_002233 [Acidimicrobiales bacterium]|jgi:hypothetical protein